ncbi:MAG: sulfatase [Planctomycetaceae bacterium]|nr:sulfatase [Planctomycetaceae bacterium]|tara:strand:+ start:3241 stop:4680 length:1440 start_codon:yes stop_codon:yes gene_type:complete
MKSPIPHSPAASPVSRRWFLEQCGVGVGSLALGALAARDNAAYGATTNEHPLAVQPPHYAPRAKRVIYLFQAGAPSHLDLYDYKAELADWSGKKPPAELLEGYRAAFIKPDSALLGPKYEFSRHGESGIEISNLLPYTASIVDKLCIVRSVSTTAVNHAPAQILMNTGTQIFGRPSFGAWSLYGLGSEATDLPGYVVLSSANGTSGGASNWGSGFLPTRFGGVPLRSSGDPILYLSNPKGVDARTQRASLDTLKRLNEQELARMGDPQIQARINAYELAYRMQTSGPELVDLTGESESTLKMYGLDPQQPKPGYAKNCLLARRLIERGVRFVQLFHEAWDHHGGLKAGLARRCGETDQASAALVTDLERRGLLEDTIVIWGGEFGRTPMVQGGGADGRDHHNRAFTMWFAGGGVKSGHVHGETDPFGFNVVRDEVPVADLHATLLHLLGMDHKKLTFRSSGLDMRLTGVQGELVPGIIA